MQISLRALPLLVFASASATFAQPTFPLYVNSGGNSYFDNLFNTWAPDSYFSGGATDSSPNAIFSAGYQQKTYSTRRYGNSFQYSFTGIATGTYQVVFKFADWEAAAGARVFNVSINGTTPDLLSKYDIAAHAGRSTAVDVTVSGIEVALGTLTISFDKAGGAYPAQVNGLVITRTGDLPAKLISSCQSITTPGNYIVTADLVVSSSPCLNIHDTGANTSTTVNCQGHSITNNTGSGYALTAVNVPSFSLSNCTFTNSTHLYTIFVSASPHASLADLTLNSASIEVFSGCDYASITHNALTRGSISVYGGAQQNVTVDHNVLNLNSIGAPLTAGIVVADADAATVSWNTMQGDLKGACSTANASCTDDGILVIASPGRVISGANVHDNTISNIYDSGIEFVGVSANVRVENNHISHAGYSGVGGWWGFSMRSGIIANNVVDDCPSLFVFSYFAGLGYPQAQIIDFYKVQITNNSLTHARSVAWVNNFFDFSAYASATQNVFDDELAGNDFGGPVDGKIGFSVPSGFTDGGDNVCTSASPSYADHPGSNTGFPIACQMAVSCSSPVSGAFRACYFANLSQTGTPALMRTDSYPLYFNWAAAAQACPANLPALGKDCPNNMSATFTAAFRSRPEHTASQPSSMARFRSQSMDFWCSTAGVRATVFSPSNRRSRPPVRT